MRSATSCTPASIAILMFHCSQVMAIVNMDTVHFKQHQNGVSGNVRFQASSSSGNTNSSDVSFNSQLQWNSDEHINLLVLGYEYGENDEQRNLNKSFIHGRHVWHYYENLDYEFFVQGEENEFTRLTYRGLLGMGVRVPFADAGNHTAYLGLGGFREVEKIAPQAGSTDEEIQRHNRWNIYLMSRYKLAEQIRFSNTLYWQPRMDESNDRRALFVSLLDFKTTRQFSVQFSIESSFDSQPPAGVEKQDTQVKTGIVFSF